MMSTLSVTLTAIIILIISVYYLKNHGMSKYELTRYIDTQAILLLIISSIISFVAFIFGLLLQRVIAGPLLHLAEVAHHIALNKDFSVRAIVDETDPQNKNEINILANVFNAMLDEIHKREKQLIEIGNTDQLTGLYNRHHLMKRINTLKSRIAENSQPVSVICIDIDYFKQINDVYGHEGGDEALKGLAQFLTEEFERNNTARLGGEEFIILLPGVDLKNAAIYAERFREKVEKGLFKISHKEQPLKQTISMGIAPLDISIAKIPWGHADEALYEAKRQGRNRVVIAQ